MRVTVQPDWKKFEIPLNTRLERMIANYIFGNDGYDDESGRDIAAALGTTFNANFDNYYASSREVGVFCSPADAPGIKAAFQAFVQEFKSVGDLPAEKAFDICNTIKNQPAPLSTSTPKPPAPK